MKFQINQKKPLSFQTKKKREQKSQNKVNHLQSHLQHWKVRDTRTFIDAKFDFGLKKNGFNPCANEEKWDSVFKAHDSAWDVLADVMRLQSITRAENDMEQITV